MRDSTGERPVPVKTLPSLKGVWCVRAKEEWGSWRATLPFSASSKILLPLREAKPYVRTFALRKLDEVEQLGGLKNSPPRILLLWMGECDEFDVRR